MVVQELDIFKVVFNSPGPKNIELRQVMLRETELCYCPNLKKKKLIKGGVEI